MSKIDSVKEKISLLKFWLGVFVASLVGIVGWCATNYRLFNRDLWLFIGSGIVIVILVYIIFNLNKKIIKLINFIDKI